MCRDGENRVQKGARRTRHHLENMIDKLTTLKLKWTTLRFHCDIDNHVINVFLLSLYIIHQMSVMFHHMLYHSLDGSGSMVKFQLPDRLR